MILTYILIFYCFAFIKLFSAENDNTNRCVQKIHNMIMKDKPKIEKFCGLESTEHENRVEELINKFIQLKFDQKSKLKNMAYWSNEILNHLDRNKDYYYNYPYNQLSSYILAIKMHYTTFAFTSGVWSPDRATNLLFYRQKDHEKSVEHDKYWKDFRIWCDYTGQKDVKYRSFFLDGCLSKCIINGEEKEFKYKFYYAKPFKNFFIIKEEFNKQAINSHNFFIQFFVDNHKEIDDSYDRCDKPERLLRRYYNEFTSLWQSCDDFYHRSQLWGEGSGIYDINCEGDTRKLPKTSFEADLLPQMPKEFGVFIILTHNCSPGGGKIYQLIKIGKFISDDTNQDDNVQQTDTIYIKLETSADNTDYAFDSLARIRKLNPAKAKDNLKEVIEKGEEAMFKNNQDAPFVQFKPINV